MTPTVFDLDHLGGIYDQPPQEDGAPRLLLVCTTPRSGSHRLGSALYSLGLGVPSEYFHPNTIAVLCARWGMANDPKAPGWHETYWREVVRRRTRNGILAVSFFGVQLGILKQLIGPADKPVFVHLYRRSMADQVASLLALYQTKMPYEGRATVANIPDISEISPRSIRILGQWLDLQNRKWRGFLADKPHLAVSSEDFFDEPAAILRAILAQGEITVSPSRLEAAAELVRGSRAYPVNAAIKRRLLQDHAAGFAALDDARRAS
jgi:LPS sulfotransferase NodH